ncbi:hypothetical protein I316_02855 [Kwoniella heveanensis BCC8398]|uniref:Uncharacterized protein n=1 Tax=Kwoniella heveanensis BCC8398 TaxID=1296120 RepID=A0A1B9GWB9_9TREE|nr:hypothetical protein I316_02855 [Kwoniella heveanensis BCC8398]
MPDPDTRLLVRDDLPDPSDLAAAIAAMPSTNVNTSTEVGADADAGAIQDAPMPPPIGIPSPLNLPSTTATQEQPIPAPISTFANASEIDPALVSDTELLDLEPLSANTLEQAMQSIQSELLAQSQQQAQGLEIGQEEMPQFSLYAPNTVNGRRMSNSNGQAKAGPSNKPGAFRSVGPELSTPSRLAAASNGAFVPTGQPPYPPPPDVHYPPDNIPNPFAEDMQPQPILENFPPNSLYRPKLLPSDIDSRLDKRSVWMGVEKDTSRAVYFLPPTCQCCKHPAVAQHCDRGWPECARCLGRGSTCIPGKAWGMMRPKGKRRNLKAEAAKNRAEAARASAPLSTTALPEEQRHSTAEKGKARASESNHLPIVPSTHQMPINAQHIAMDLDSSQLQATKKRRSSVGGENSAKRARRKSGRDSLAPLQGEILITPADRAYLDRLEANNRKPPLTNMNGPCPVWAKTRRALQSAVEYLRDPKQTAGGSVELGVGGIARGLILEGDVGAQGLYWGTGEHSGTIITTIGHPRRQRRDSIIPPRYNTPPLESSTEPFARPLTPPLNILPTIASFDSSGTTDPDPANRFWSPKKSEPTPLSFDEEPAVSALLKAQRYRTPIAVAVAQDYAAVPFKVPRPLVVLGWFYIVDAWLEPVMPDLELFTSNQRAPLGPPERVIWKFRLEWCDDGKETPWWSSSLEPSRRPIPSPDRQIEKNTWHVDAPTLNGSLTVRPLSYLDDAGHSAEYAHLCDNCHSVSEKVYASGKICLNEKCSWFFGDASDFRNRIGPISNKVFTVRPRARIPPTVLNLQLRPPEPTGDDVETSQDLIGRNFWRGWVCGKCGLAQERYKWSGWNCEACGHFISHRRKVYSEVDLRNPSRPVCTGTRQEDGYAIIPPQYTRHVWSLLPDMKHVFYSFDPIIFGPGGGIHHIMNHEGKGVHEAASNLLKTLQTSGKGELALRRLPAPAHSPRPIDAVLSSFYTYLCGPETTPEIPTFPTNRPVNRLHAPLVCTEALDLVKERTSRMFNAQKEFNNLLIVAVPPGLPASLMPRMSINPLTQLAVLFLGSDQVLRIRSSQTKQAEITVQHGDVIGIMTSREPIELGFKPEGFGFLCIARRVEESDQASHVPATATARLPSEEVTSDMGLFSGLTHVDPLAIRPAQDRSAEPHYPANGAPPQDFSSLIAEPIPPPIASSAELPDGHLVKSDREHPKTKPRPRPSLPPKPAKLAEPPLTDWYIGAIPMDKKQPMRILPPFRAPLSSLISPANGEEAEGGQNPKEGDVALKTEVIDDRSPGVQDTAVEKEFLTEYPEPAKLLEPAPLSPLPGYDDLESEEPAEFGPVPTPASALAPVASTSTSKKATPASKARARASVSGITTPVVANTPTPTKTTTSSSGRGNKKKSAAQPRLSGVSTPAGSVHGGGEKEDGGTPSSKGSGRASGPGPGSRGRGRGRGRKSNVE